MLVYQKVSVFLVAHLTHHGVAVMPRHQVQGLTGSSPPGPSGLVSNEAVNATLALAEAGVHGCPGELGG